MVIIYILCTGERDREKMLRGWGKRLFAKLIEKFVTSNCMQNHTIYYAFFGNTGR